MDALLQRSSSAFLSTMRLRPLACLSLALALLGSVSTLPACVVGSVAGKYFLRMHHLPLQPGSQCFLLLDSETSASSHPSSSLPLQEGYAADGNEFSFYMLLTSAFLLNHCHRKHQVQRRWASVFNAPAPWIFWIRTPISPCPLAAVDRAPVGALGLQPPLDRRSASGPAHP